MVLYTLTILCSSSLLFLVQPLIAKQILPWFGGSAAVWTSCLLFFQGILLAGYAYSDLIQRLSARYQIQVHGVLLVLSLIALPIIPNDTWKPNTTDDPLWQILGLLLATVGLPYFVLSATGPLLQSWAAKEYLDRPLEARRVYRLFAWSNLGSLGGLLAYPFLIEMWVPVQTQALGWGWIYAGFIALMLLCAKRYWNYRQLHPSLETISSATQTETDSKHSFPPPSVSDYLKWLSTAGVASMLLLAISNYITQDIASIPLLWVLPLTLYLLTFVLSFEGRGGRGWYQRFWGMPLSILFLWGMVWGLSHSPLHIDIAIPLFSAGLFFVCLCCHGELAASAPPSQYLTRFYLALSAGGVLGSISVAVIAPRLWSGPWELPLGFLVCAILFVILSSTGKPPPLKNDSTTANRWSRLSPWGYRLLAGGFVLLAPLYLSTWYTSLHEDNLLMIRNFYGPLRVKYVPASEDLPIEYHLVHGVIEHGKQYVDPEYRQRPTSYYGISSGIGLLLGHIYVDTPIRYGVIGMGVGTLAAYARRGDYVRFYEINPLVVSIAQEYFYYTKDSPADISVALGDARLVLERESSQQFHVLIVDAFSSDAIPTHLITHEALLVYTRHLRPGGVIAFHVTNRYLDLAPVIQKMATEQGYQSILVSDDPPEESDLARTDWVIVTRNPQVLTNPELQKAKRKINDIPNLEPWTDNFNNLFQVLKSNPLENLREWVNEKNK